MRCPSWKICAAFLPRGGLLGATTKPRLLRWTFVDFTSYPDREKTRLCDLATGLGCPRDRGPCSVLHVRKFSFWPCRCGGAIFCRELVDWRLATVARPDVPDAYEAKRWPDGHVA